MVEVVTSPPEQVDPKKVKEQRKLAEQREALGRGMRYIFDQINGARFSGKIREEDVRALNRVIVFLGKEIPVEGKGTDFPREMQRAYQVYLEAGFAHALVRGLATAKEEYKQTIRAQLDADVRERLGRNPDLRVTEKMVESQVFADPKYKSYLAELMDYQTLSDMTYNLRESTQRHFMMLEHRSNDQRAAFKAGS
jgi:hypothetical protein